MEMILLGLCVWLAGFAALGWYVAAVKRRPIAEGIVLAILIGPLGLILVALLPQGDRMPPERIHADLGTPKLPVDDWGTIEQGMGRTIMIGVSTILVIVGIVSIFV